VAAGHDIVLVLTQPDRPAGRGLHAAQSAVKRYAVARHIPVIQPLRLKDTPEIEQVRTAGVDALVVAAYGLLLPQPLLEAGRHGALNIHASLLPRWRGAAPIQRALLAGDAETGVSIMQMEAGLDTGPVLRQQRLPIAPDADAATLHDALAALGATEIVAALADLDAGRARAVPQPADGVTYAAKIEKRETRLDWSRPALELERAVRAFRPAPGAFALLDGEPVKIWRGRVVDGNGKPGSVLDRQENIVIACGQRALAVSELQRAGGRRQPAAEYLRGHPLAAGARFA
jgi:methionyl-tRNA formyltransferase